MRAKLAVLVACMAMLLAGVQLVAHHSFAAEFDANKPVKLTGVVTRVEWMNPHAWFYIDVVDEVGKVEKWGLELGSPNGLIRAGWTRSSLKIGEKVAVEGTRARDGTLTANARTVILVSTGQRLFAASSQTQTP